MRSRTVLLAGAISTVISTFGMAAYAPIALTADSFTFNAVAGSGPHDPAATFGPYTNVTAGMDGGVYALPGAQTPNYTYYTKGYDSSASSTGVPLGTTIQSAFDPNTLFTLAAVDAVNNVAGFSNQAGGGVNATASTMTFLTPAAYSSLAFLGAFNASSTLNYIINFVGGSTEAGSLAMGTWGGSGSNIAYTPEGRVLIPDGTHFDQVNNGGHEALLRQSDVTVVDTTDLISSISFAIPSGTSERELDAIFAISGSPVPEPASAALLLVCSAGLLVRRRRTATST